MRWDHPIFVGMLFGSILGVFYSTTLTPYFPLLVLLGVVYLLGFFVHARK